MGVAKRQIKHVQIIAANLNRFQSEKKIESKERKYDYFFAVFLLSTKSTRALTLEIRDMLAHFYKIHGCLRTSGIILDSR